MSKMTIHRGLSELKLIDAKVTKLIENLQPTAIIQKGRKIGGHLDKEIFEANAKSTLDSIRDLLRRKSLIKTAIVKANTETQVTVAGVPMSVADAITHKEAVKLKKALVASLVSKSKATLSFLNKHNEEVEKKVQSNLEAMLGKDSTTVSKDDIDMIRKPFMEANEAHLVDPLNVDKLVETISSEVESFEAEVDAVLSESNAITYIEI